jgi:LacI family transcriptional regulator
LKEAESFSKKCSRLKIPMVYVNSKLNAAEFLSYIGQDSYASGKVAAGLMNGILGKEKLLAVLNIEQYPENQVHIKEREMGFIDYSTMVAGKSSRNILIFNIAKAEARFINDELEMIFSGQQIDGVFITNSRAFHIARWLETHKKYRPLVIGYDLIAENCRMLNKGLIRFLISQNPEEQGYKSVRTLFNHMILGRNVEQNQLLPIDIITAENLTYYNT